MPIVLEMPSLSPTMEKGNLVAWCKNEGDEISVGDVIAEIDTDKATMEVESIYKGVLEKIIVPAGTHDVLVKTPIAIIRQKNDTDEDIKKALSGIKNSNSADESANVEPNIEMIDSENASKMEESKSSKHTNCCSGEGSTKASPLAKRIANEYGIDLSGILGTGPGGRIIKDDVISLKEMTVGNRRAEIQNSPKFADEKISSMRRVIAEKLSASKRDTPHFYMQTSANVTDLLKIRKIINDSGKLSTKITVNDFIVKAVALAMRDEPNVNVSWNNGLLRRFSTVDVAVAVAIEGGLMTPIIWSADMKSLRDLSVEIKLLAQNAKDGKLVPDQFIGGGITVSNLGMYKIDSFLSIINPPQGSILSIGPAKKTPIFDGEDLVAADIMNIGYAVDHRVIDGGDAARFLECFVKYLENPALLII